MKKYVVYTTLRILNAIKNQSRQKKNQNKNKVSDKATVHQSESSVIETTNENSGDSSKYTTEQATASQVHENVNITSALDTNTSASLKPKLPKLTPPTFKELVTQSYVVGLLRIGYTCERQYFKN